MNFNIFRAIHEARNRKLNEDRTTIQDLSSYKPPISKEDFQEKLMIQFCQYNPITIEDFFRKQLKNHSNEDFISALEYAFSKYDDNPFSCHNANRTDGIIALLSLEDKLSSQEMSKALNIICSHAIQASNVDLTFLYNYIPSSMLENIVINNFIPLFEKMLIQYTTLPSKYVTYFKTTPSLEKFFIENAEQLFSQISYYIDFEEILYTFPCLAQKIYEYYIKNFLCNGDLVYSDELPSILLEMADYEKFENIHFDIIREKYLEILDTIHSYKDFYMCSEILKENFNIDAQAIENIVDEEINCFIDELLTNKPFMLHDHVSATDIREFLYNKKAYEKFMDNLYCILKTNNLYFAAHVVEIFGCDLPKIHQNEISKCTNILFYSE